jgi:hypothetical protein
MKLPEPQKISPDYTLAISQAMTPDQRKLMSCGGSLILDLIDQTNNNEFKKLFSTEAWDALDTHYKSLLLLREADMPETLMAKFKYGIRLAVSTNRCEDSDVYFSLIYSQKTMTTTQRRIIKLFMTMFDIVQNSSYLLQSTYKKNNSEGNYLTEIWFPVLKSLFAINGNLVRLKVGETIPGDSTEEKSRLYVGEKHIVGFKTDIRFICDYDDSEFDIGALEVCLPGAEDDKVTNDEAKLLREGKSMSKALHHVTSGDIDASWIIQVSGFKAYFSTVSYVGNDFYVDLLQSEISFPSSISELNDDVKVKSFFQGLFKLCDGIESSAHIIQRRIKQTNDDQNTTHDKFHDSGF